MRVRSFFSVKIFKKCFIIKVHRAFSADVFCGTAAAVREVFQSVCLALWMREAFRNYGSEKKKLVGLCLLLKKRKFFKKLLEK